VDDPLPNEERLELTALAMFCVAVCISPILRMYVSKFLLKPRRSSSATKPIFSAIIRRYLLSSQIGVEFSAHEHPKLPFPSWIRNKLWQRLDLPG
jgi:hypothetical protein